MLYVLLNFFTFRPPVLALISCVLAFAFSSNVFASNVIKMGVSFSIPPWVIKETNTGIELDVLNAAFEKSDYEVKLVYAPFARVHKLFDAGRIDGFINSKPDPAMRGFLSDPVVTFENMAISLASKNFPEDISIGFLADKQVIAFQKASKLISKEFGSMAANNAAYQEIPKQSLQINLLFVRKVDFIVMDKSIFGYYWNEAIESQPQNLMKFDYSQEVRFHRLFEPTHYAFRFKDEGMRDAFNSGLRRIKQSGEYDQIFQRYDKLKDLYQSKN